MREGFDKLSENDQQTIKTFIDDVEAEKELFLKSIDRDEFQLKSLFLIALIKQGGFEGLAKPCIKDWIFGKRTLSTKGLKKIADYIGLDF